MRRALVDTGDHQHVAARPFEIAQIVRMIDDARQVGVLEIDADGKAMRAADEAAAGGWSGSVICPL